MSKAGLCGRLCDECTEPLAGAKLRLYAMSADLALKDAAAPAKETFTMISEDDTAEMVLTDCRVPRNMVLGGEGNGIKVAFNALDISRIGIASQALGIAQGAFDFAVQYAQERETFGKPIILHQSIGNYLADMATRIDAARLLVYRAAWMKDQGLVHTKESSMAKLYAGDVAAWVADRAVQIHGGYGYTRDFPVERYYRDAKITQIYEGTQEIQRLVISRALMGSVKGVAKK